MVLVARSESDLHEVREGIEDLGSEVLVFPTDLSERKNIEELWSEVEDGLGRIDVLVNAAGVWHGEDEAFYGPKLEETPADQIDQVMDVGIRAPLHLSRLVLSKMKERSEGKIINISGTFESGASGWLHYFVSKKALEKLTVGLAEEAAEDGVQVNCISPSDTLTEPYKEFFPDYNEDQILHPEEIAEHTLYLIESDNLTGQVIQVRDPDSY